RIWVKSGQTIVGQNPPLFAIVGGLNRSTQHFILNGKDGVFGDVARISSRFHCGRENGVVGSLAARGVAQSDWAGVWQAVIIDLLPGGPARWDSVSASRRCHWSIASPASKTRSLRPSLVITVRRRL